MLTPKALSTRNSNSGDSAALPFNRSGSGARRPTRDGRCGGLLAHSCQRQPELVFHVWGHDPVAPRYRRIAFRQEGTIWFAVEYLDGNVPVSWDWIPDPGTA